MKLRVLLICVLVCGIVALAFLTSKNKKNMNAPPAQKGVYIVMEKVLADTPGRPRTTMKIIIPAAANKPAVTGSIVKALADARAQDPALKAAIIWAYRSRGELNGSNFTLGKLEWSADGMDFAAKKKLVSNPNIEILVQ